MTGDMDISMNSAAGNEIGDIVAGLSASANPAPHDSNDLTQSSSPKLQSILRIPVLLQVVVGSATLEVANLLKLGSRAIVPLDRRVGEPVDVMINGRVIARGEVVVLEDDNTRFGVSLTEMLEPRMIEEKR
jgi:flagellar motor switch protein FliN/FliY